MNEEQKLEHIKERLGEETVEFLKKSRIHPHLKDIIVSHMVDYATVKENLELLIEETGVKGVSPYSSKSKYEEALKLRDL